MNAVGLTTVTLPLPSDFTNETALNVEHLKSAAKTYIYKGSIIDTSTASGTTKAADGANGVQILTFNNPNGFSLFKVGSETKIVAEIDGVGYPSLQAAVDDVQNGQTITVNTTGEATVANKTISFKVTCKDDVTATIKDYQGNPLTPDENGVYTVTRKSTGSGSGVTTYAISTNSPRQRHGDRQPQERGEGRHRHPHRCPTGATSWISEVGFFNIS